MNHCVVCVLNVCKAKIESMKNMHGMATITQPPHRQSAGVKQSVIEQLRSNLNINNVNFVYFFLNFQNQHYVLLESVICRHGLPKNIQETLRPGCFIVYQHGELLGYSAP